MDQCIFEITGGNFTGYYRFLKGFYGLADILIKLLEKIDQTLENKHRKKNSSQKKNKKTTHVS